MYGNSANAMISLPQQSKYINHGDNIPQGRVELRNPGHTSQHGRQPLHRARLAQKLPLETQGRNEGSFPLRSIYRGF